MDAAESGCVPALFARDAVELFGRVGAALVRVLVLVLLLLLLLLLLLVLYEDAARGAGQRSRSGGVRFAHRGRFPRARVARAPL